MTLRVAPIIAGMFVATLLFTGCTDDDAPRPTDPTSTRAMETAPVVTLTVENGQPVGGPQTLTVDVGATVAFDVVSDEADELHIHGYDRTVELPAGTLQRVEFTADIPGVFEIELHHAGTEIAQLRVGG